MEHCTRKVYFTCQFESCTAFFVKEEDLIEHSSIGIHSFINSLSVMDDVKKYFVNIKTSVHTNNLLEAIVASDDSFSLSEYNSSYELGWARPVRSKSSFTKEQKGFVIQAFEIGERTKIKKTAETIMEEMKQATKDGIKVFKAKDILTARQIKNIIHSLSTKTPSSKKRRLTGLDDVMTEFDDEDVEDFVYTATVMALGAIE